MVLFCDACGGSIAKGQRVEHTRDGRILCEPCRDRRLAELRRKAEEALERARQRGDRQIPDAVVAVVLLLLLAALGWLVVRGVSHTNSVAEASTPTTAGE